jgi:hypothetical protein
VLQQSIPGAMSGGYRMQLRVRTQSGEQRSLACTYSSQTQQVRLDPL